MMSLRHAVALLPLVLLATMAGGCDENLSTIAGPTPNLTPTFSSIERELFNTSDSSGRPACTNCHTDAGGRVPPTGMVLLTGRAYDSIVNVAARNKPGAIRIIPGDPVNSYFIHKLEERTDIVGVRMPQRGPYLTDGQIAIIKRWVELGARRD